MSYPKSDKHIYALTVYDVPVRSFLFTTRMRLTAMELYRLAITNIRSRHRLAITLPDLCYVCAHKSFPNHYTVDIYSAILERFTRQYEEFRSVENDLRDTLLARALDICYNHLSTHNVYDENITSVILRFLEAFVSRSVEEYLFNHYEVKLFSPLPDDYPRGEVYRQFQNDWQNTVINQQLFTPYKSINAWHDYFIEQFKIEFEKLEQTPEYQASHREQIKRERIARIMSYSQMNSISDFGILL